MVGRGPLHIARYQQYAHRAPLDRLASIALGTGDIDCVYHVALDELIDATVEAWWDDASELLKVMIDGARLKDISDLPLIVFGSAARGDGGRSSDSDVLLIRPREVSFDDPVWASAVADLCISIRRWSGNPGSVD